MATWAGVAYVGFITDAYSRMIVGWRVAPYMRTEMVLDAIEMARFSRGTQLTGLRCHSDAGSQFTSLRYGKRLAEIGAIPAIGTTGDSYDNALAETVNGYYKAELIYRPAHSGPWKTTVDVELATLSWVYWHNHRRLHGYCDDLPPAEYEQRTYATEQGNHALAEINSQSLHQTQSDSVCIAPGLMEAFILRKDESYGSTEEVPVGFAADGVGGPAGPGGACRGAIKQVADQLGSTLRRYGWMVNAGGWLR